tara:strand:+ start:847 stop:1128 length:282 start_codon:yes stop_codon:yes gene_type:complete
MIYLRFNKGKFHPIKQRTKMNFGQWVIWQLNILDKSQQWLTDEVGMSGGTVQRYVKGQTPGLYQVIKIVQVLANHRRIDPNILICELLDLEKK